MKKTLVLLVISLASFSTLLAKAVKSGYGDRIEVSGHKVRVLTAGQGGPTVVLETSGMAPLECWGFVLPAVAKFTRVVAYDHAGYWGSEAGPKPRDAEQIARELHTLLQEAELSLPFVMVGYSFGGPFVRVFAHRYPNEVAGMVFVDPSQEEAFEWLKRHRPEVNKISKADELEQDEWGCSWPSLSQARAAWPLPTVPVTLITAMRHDSDPLLRDFMPIWLAAHREWLRGLPHARHIVTEKSDHGIVFEEPELVVDAIRDVVEQARHATR